MITSCLHFLLGNFHFAIIIIIPITTTFVNRPHEVFKAPLSCIFISASTTPPQLQSTSLPGDRENDCTCSESSNSAVIAVSAVSLLLIITLTTVILTQCLLILRMRKSKDVLHSKETYAEVMTPTTKHTDVPVTPNEAYALSKITSSSDMVTYELVK